MPKNKAETGLTLHSAAVLIFPVLLLLAVIIFFAMRLPPLMSHNVSYTYDQGRDFFAAGSMILNHRPTFLGPTTGVSGLFHGAWWYYVLAIPFVILKGLPIGFYFFNLLLQTGVFALFIYFGYRYAGKLAALVIAFLIGPSPYFMLTVVQIGNNIMVVPPLALFIFLSFILFSRKEKEKVHWWKTALLGICLGLVAEFELSFGMFIIPLTFAAIILFRKLRTAVFTARGLVSFAVGLGIIFLPRLFFELRHEFLQTHTLLNFFIKPHLYNPKPYIDVLRDRISLFKDYYYALSDSAIIPILLGILIIYLLWESIRLKSLKPYFYYMVFLLCGLFMLSTFYKDTFWSNYFEGIQLFFLAAVICLIQVTRQTFVKNSLLIMVMLVLIVSGLANTYKTVTAKPSTEGLVKMERIVNYITDQAIQGKGNNCVKVYTPPVIPHTYNYLFMYRNVTRKIPVPETQWIDKKCWFVLERDDYQARKVKWMNDQGLDRSTRLYGTRIIDTDVVFYEIKE